MARIRVNRENLFKNGIIILPCDPGHIGVALHHVLFKTLHLFCFFSNIEYNTILALDNCVGSDHFTDNIPVS